MKILWNKEGTRVELKECDIAIRGDYKKVYFVGTFSKYQTSIKSFDLDDIIELKQIDELIIIHFNKSQLDANGKMIKHVHDIGCAYVNSNYVEL